MPSSIRVTVSLTDAQQAYVRKMKWNGTKHGEILEQIKDQLERHAPQTGRCSRCGQDVQLLNGLLTLHYGTRGSNFCSFSDTAHYIAPGCTCQNEAGACYCGAAQSIPLR